MRHTKKIISLTAAVAVGAIVTGAPAYAAKMLTGADIKNSSLTGADVRNNSLTGRDIKDLTGSDIKNGSIKKGDLAKGVIPDPVPGPAGPAGATGPKGDTGPAGPGTRWALIAADGTIAAQSGGFSIVAAYPVLPNTAAAPGDNSLRANGNVYINTGEDLSNKGLLASISLQNQVDLNSDGITSGRAAGPDANPEFSGEATVAKCEPSPAVFVACAPPGAQNNNTLVVSPRNSDGSFTTDGARKRFYVSVVG